MELSPESLGRLLAPEWAIDARVLKDAFVVDDIYPVGGDDPRILVSLRAAQEGEAVRVVICPDVAGPANRVAAGLAVSWLPPATGPARHAEGNAACVAVATLLTSRLGAATRRWRVPREVELRVPVAVANEVSVGSATLTDDPDASLLARDFAQYERLFASAPRAIQIDVAGEEGAGMSLHYPAPSNGREPPSGALYRAPTRFHRRRFRRYFARLGCSYDDGVARTVPSPEAFGRAVRRLTGAPAVLQPRLVVGRREATSAAAWARSVVHDGVLPVSVAPRWAVEVHRLIRHIPAFARIPVDVGMLPHDAWLHGIGLHAIERSLFDALREVARARLREGGRGAAPRVAAFYEDTLTRAAWETWNELEAPEDFAAEFAVREGELIEALRAA